MAFSTGKSQVTLKDILECVSEADILAFYLNITTVPCVVCSPLREDKNPSFGFYSLDGRKIYYRDLSTGDKGGLFDLLTQLWVCDYPKALEKVYNDMCKFTKKAVVKKQGLTNVTTSSSYNKNTDLQCRVREWKKHDIEYWEKFGISINWLKYADVYPISHKIVIKDAKKYVLSADKYAYAYVEKKEGNVTLKIYQPFNKEGYKWSNKHDSSVLSLWTKVPKQFTNICICASLKDALCLWANTGIPSIAVQGEGYNISETAVKELKKNYDNIYILFDNDEAGITDAEKLAEKTGFTNIVLPKFEGGKDVSDYYYILQDREKFKTDILNLFKKK